MIWLEIYVDACFIFRSTWKCIWLDKDPYHSYWDRNITSYRQTDWDKWRPWELGISFIYMLKFKISEFSLETHAHLSIILLFGLPAYSSHGQFSREHFIHPFIFFLLVLSSFFFSCIGALSSIITSYKSLLFPKNEIRFVCSV